jgi:hypothetical protein
MNTATVSSSLICDPIAIPAESPSSRCPYFYPTARAAASRAGQLTLAFVSATHGPPRPPLAVLVPVPSDSEDLSADLLPELPNSTPV